MALNRAVAYSTEPKNPCYQQLFEQGISHWLMGYY
jgi:hypothetical protein